MPPEHDEELPPEHERELPLEHDQEIINKLPSNPLQNNALQHDNIILDIPKMDNIQQYQHTIDGNVSVIQNEESFNAFYNFPPNRQKDNQMLLEKIPS